MSHYLGYVLEQLTHPDERELDHWRHRRLAGGRPHRRWWWRLVFRSEPRRRAPVTVPAARRGSTAQPVVEPRISPAQVLGK